MEALASASSSFYVLCACVTVAVVCAFAGGCLLGYALGADPGGRPRRRQR